MAKKRQADIVIAAFGGVRSCAKALGRSPGSVSKWTSPVHRASTYGKVPDKLKLKILAIAERDHLKITAKDLGL